MKTVPALTSIPLNTSGCKENGFVVLPPKREHGPQPLQLRKLKALEFTVYLEDHREAETVGFDILTILNLLA